MANITEFRNALKSGVLRQHKWRVIFNFPAYAGNTDNSRQASLLARTATTPSSTLGVIELQWGGRTLPLPGDRTYEEFPVTFIGTNDMNIRNAFESWSENINGSQSNAGIVDPESFVKDIQFDLTDINDTVIKTYILKDAFPVSISGMDMDAGSQDSFAEFTVTFRYVNYQSNTTL
jgi:hypothetical protein